jgi:hypothetical protein
MVIIGDLSIPQSLARRAELEKAAYMDAVLTGLWALAGRSWWIRLKTLDSYSVTSSRYLLPALLAPKSLRFRVTEILGIIVSFAFLRYKF